MEAVQLRPDIKEEISHGRDEGNAAIFWMFEKWKNKIGKCTDEDGIFVMVLGTGLRAGQGVT